jgi:hypothetical protein
MKKVLLAAAVFFQLSGACFAQTTVKAELDKIKATTDEPVTYKLTVVSGEQRLAAPSFPDLKAFDILSQSQSSNISLTGEGMKTMLVYVFVLLPREPGSIEIPPSVVTAGKEKLSSEKFTLEVSPGTGRFRRPGQAPRQPGKLPRSLGDEPQYEL